MIGAPGINMAFVYQTTPLLTEAVATLQAPDAAAGDSFGKAVSVCRNGTWIVVGAPHRDEGGSADKGAVYVFRFTQGQWTYHSKITSNLAVANDRFGWSASIDDSLGRVVVLVGCNYRIDYSGFVEVFELQSPGELLLIMFLVFTKQSVLTKWLTRLNEPAAASVTWTATWSNVIGGNGAMYGYSVSLSGGSMAVGSPSDNYEYLNDQGMSCLKTLCRETVSDILVVECCFRCWHLTRDFAGTIFHYLRNDDGTWRSTDKTGGGMWGRSSSNMKVGWAVAQDGDFQAAGAPGESSNKGAVYVREVSSTVYRGSGFVVEPDTASGSLFGSAVALSWPFLAVGAPGRSPEGAAFLYQFSAGSWIKVGSRIDPAAVALSIPSFGRSIAVSQAMLLVGGSGSAWLRAPEVSTLQPTLVMHALSLFLLL